MAALFRVAGRLRLGRERTWSLASRLLPADVLRCPGDVVEEAVILAHDQHITLSEWLVTLGLAELATVLGIGLAVLISKAWPLHPDDSNTGQSQDTRDSDG